MNLTTQQYQTMLNEVDDIRYLVIKSGGMATKSRVEDILMDVYDLDRGEAHDLTNQAERRNDHAFSLSPLRWTASRPEPQVRDWPAGSFEVTS